MDIQLPQIIFQIINFSVVAGALTYLLYKPVLKILEERTRKIEDAQKAAQETLTERERLSDVEKDIKNKAEKEAAEILDKARQDSKRIAQEARAAAAKETQNYLEQQKTAWSSEKKRDSQEMKDAFVSTVIATASKVIGAELDQKKHQKLIDSQLEELLSNI